MSTTAAKPKINHGRNLQRKRIAYNIKQETIAEAYGCKQQFISQLENQEVISDDILTWFANFYSSPIEDLRDKEVRLEAPSVTITNNNTFTEYSSANVGNYGDTNHDNIYNSEELINRLCYEKDKQLEKLLATLNTIFEMEKLERIEYKKLLSEKQK